ncbi:MAG: tetratricopeptide repeat protein [Thermoanaerobaculia bacterium]
MRAYVFTDSSLARYAGQFVWLSIDIENAKNAATLKKLTIEGVPSFFVVDPATEEVAFRWLGAATVAQLPRIFDDGRRAVMGSEDRIKSMLAKADRLYAEGKNAEAAKSYQSVLKDAPANWPSRARVTESLLFALQSSDQGTLCATTAAGAYPRFKNTASAANIAAVGLDCAVGLPEDAIDRQKLIASLEAAAEEALANPKVKVAADDRSGIFMSLINAREAAKDDAGTKTVVTRWAAFLEAEAAKAKTPDERAVFDSHRLTAYMQLKTPERAIPMLEASERDLPTDYNPPARLAVAYNAMKKYDEALKASDRALKLVYGPRKLGVLQTRADIYAGMGDKTAAIATLEDAVRIAEELPEGQRSERRVTALKKKIESMR